MIDIKPVSDMRNKISDTDQTVESGKPVYLTKNGYGTMAEISIEEYSGLTDSIETALDQADNQAASTTKRLTADEVFSTARKAVNQ